MSSISKSSLLFIFLLFLELPLQVLQSLTHSFLQDFLQGLHSLLHSFLHSFFSQLLLHGLSQERLHSFLHGLSQDFLHSFFSQHLPQRAASIDTEVKRQRATSATTNFFM